MTRPINNVRVIINDYTRGTEHHVSDKVVRIVKSMSMESTPGKCEVTMLQAAIPMTLGSILSVYVNGIKFFNGRIFIDKTTSDGLTTLTAYDALHAFKGSDSMVFENKTLTQIFIEICGRFGTSYVIHDTARTRLPKIKTDNSTFFSIILEAINQTLLISDNLWVIRGEWSQVEFLNVALHYNRNPRVLVIGDSSLATGYSLTRSGEDIRNAITLINDNNEDKVRHRVTYQDLNSQRQFGKLMEIQQSSEEMNLAQIQERARDILSSKSRIKTTFDVSVIGHESLIKMRSGDAIMVNFQELGKFNINMRPLLIDGITHNIEGNSYTVDFNLLQGIL